MLAGLGPVGPSVLVGLPFAAAAFVILAWSPLRERNFAVVLHAHGVVVSKGASHDRIAFDDVDEVWLVLDTVTTSFGSLSPPVALEARAS